MIAYIQQHRTSAAPFDVVRFGDMPQGTPAEINSKLSVWAEAGITWWISGTTGRQGAPEAMRRQIRQGPPIGESK